MRAPQKLMDCLISSTVPTRYFTRVSVTGLRDAPKERLAAMQLDMPSVGKTTPASLSASPGIPHSRNPNAVNSPIERNPGSADHSQHGVKDKRCEPRTVLPGQPAAQRPSRLHNARKLLNTLGKHMLLRLSISFSEDNLTLKCYGGYSYVSIAGISGAPTSDF